MEPNGKDVGEMKVSCWRLLTVNFFFVFFFKLIFKAKNLDSLIDIDCAGKRKL